MAHSSILGADRAPLQPAGRDADALGPSDTSDSGSDIRGEIDPDLLDSDSDSEGTGERGSAVDGEHLSEGADIAPDRIVPLLSDTVDLDAEDARLGDAAVEDEDEEADADEDGSDGNGDLP